MAAQEDFFKIIANGRIANVRCAKTLFLKFVSEIIMSKKLNINANVIFRCQINESIQRQ